MRRLNDADPLPMHLAYGPDHWATHPEGGPRIQVTQDILRMELDGKAGLTIIEIGCNSGELSGPFAKTHHVTGYDCSRIALGDAVSRYPGMQVVLGDVLKAEPQPSDLLIVCEVLEHLDRPLELVERWLPLAKTCLLSHPLGEDETAAYIISAGFHHWSYDEEDFREWFRRGGHSLAYRTILDENLLGYPHQTIIGVGRRTG